MPEFYIINIISYRFHFDNDDSESVIVYYIIIGWDLMVRLLLPTDFKQQVLSWDDDALPMKGPGNFLGQPSLTKRKIHEVVIQT